MKRVIHLPVGSNISPCPISTEEQKALRERFPCEVLLGCFGSFHPSKDYTGVLQSLVELDRDIKLLFIGATIEQIIVEYPSVDAQKLTERVYAVGFLNNKETFEHLNILDGFVGYFSDGVSTRRGSIIAAIDLAIPIFTSKSERTEQVFGELEFVFLHSNQQNEFKSQLLKTLQNFDFNRESSFETSKKLAREFFSWKSIISLYRQNS